MKLLKAFPCNQTANHDCCRSIGPPQQAVAEFVEQSSKKENYRQLMTEKERLEAANKSQEASLERLQHVLQQFTHERQRDIVVAQKELAHKLARAETLQGEKDSEIAHLRTKLAEAQLGLEAAGRLTQQLDKTTAALSAAKEEGNASRFSDSVHLCTQHERARMFAGKCFVPRLEICILHFVSAFHFHLSEFLSKFYSTTHYGAIWFS